MSIWNYSVPKYYLREDGRNDNPNVYWDSLNIHLIWNRAVARRAKIDAI